MSIILCCGIRMEKIESGIVVFEMAGERVYKIWHADLFNCSICNNKIIGDFADSPIATEWTDNYQITIKKYECTAYTWYERARNKHLVCVNNGDYKVSLTVGQIYLDITKYDDKGYANGLIRVIDDTGEDYLFPKELFKRQ